MFAGHLGHISYFCQDRACIFSPIHICIFKTSSWCRCNAPISFEKTAIVSKECQRAFPTLFDRHFQHCSNQWSVIYCSQDSPSWSSFCDRIHPTNLGLSVCSSYSKRDDQHSKGFGNRPRLFWNRNAISSWSSSFPGLLWWRSLTCLLIFCLGNRRNNIQNKSENRKPIPGKLYHALVWCGPSPINIPSYREFGFHPMDTEFCDCSFSSWCPFTIHRLDALALLDTKRRRFKDKLLPIPSTHSNTHCGSHFPKRVSDYTCDNRSIHCGSRYVPCIEEFVMVSVSSE